MFTALRSRSVSRLTDEAMLSEAITHFMDSDVRETRTTFRIAQARVYANRWSGRNPFSRKFEVIDLTYLPGYELAVATDGRLVATAEFGEDYYYHFVRIDELTNTTVYWSLYAFRGH